VADDIPIVFTQDISVTLVNSQGDDAQIARAAWVSTKGERAEDVDTSKVANILKFLLKGRHGTPFEHNSMTFLVQAPLFVFREWHRHRIGWSYNEESGRYSEMRPNFYLPGEFRHIVQSGSPGAYQYFQGTQAQHNLVNDEIKVNCQEAYAAYKRLLEADIAREVARMVLPLNLMSSMYATCNARSMMNFLQLRTENPDATFISHPMHEINVAADQLEHHFANLFPMTHGIWDANGRVAP